MSLQGDIESAIHGALNKWFNDISDDLKKISEDGGKAAAGGILGDVGRITDIISSVLGDIPLVGELLASAADPLKPIEDAAGKFGLGISIGYTLAYLASPALQPPLLPLIHASNDLFTNEIFDPQTAAQLVARGIIAKDFGASEAAGGGFDRSHFNQMVDAAETRPDTGTLLKAFNLGLIGQDDVELAFQRHGIPQFWWGPLLTLRRELLSVADLGLAQLRGNIDPQTAETYAASLGMSADDYQTIIGNIGEPPGTMQLLEAYRRGYIDQPTLERGIRQSRTRNEWIPTIEKLRYERLSVATAINATVQGYLTADQGRAAAALSGLDPDDFDVAHETAGEPMARGEMLKLWKRGKMTRDQVEQGIRESHVKDKYIPYILDYGTELFGLRDIREILSAGQADAAWGVQYLLTLGYTQDDATRFANTFAGPATSKAKGATESQILELYNTHAITPDAARGYLKKLGYPDEQIDLVLKAEDAKVIAAEQNRAIAAVRTKYLAGHYSVQNATGLLDGLGVPAGQRDQLLADWQLELAGQVKVLTAAQIVAAVKWSIYTIDQGISALVAQGYSQADAATLVYIELHGVPPAAPGAQITPGGPTGVRVAGA